MADTPGEVQCEWQECSEQPDFVVDTRWGDVLFCKEHTKQVEQDGDGERVGEYFYEDWFS